MTQVIFAVAGLVLLTFAADHLVLGASRIAARLKLSPVIVGVVIIGLGTSAPEFLVSGVAAAQGDEGIAIGNIVGSNILNLSLILGIAALIRPIHVASTVIAREVPLAVAAVAFFAITARIGLTPIAAIPLGIAAIGAIVLLIKWAKGGQNQEIGREAEEFSGQAKAAEPVRAILGLAGVLIGAQLLVANASVIAERLGVSQIVIGFTLVALGTSLPELVTVIAATRRGETDLVVGNLFGSNLFNSLAGASIVGFASGMDSPAKAATVLLAAMVAAAGLAWFLLSTGRKLTRAEGAVLLAAYALTLPLLLSTS